MGRHPSSSERLLPLCPGPDRGLTTLNSCGIILPMVPPTWLHERGQPRLKQPCPSCGREIPVLILPPDLLRFYGWQPFKVWSSVEWCGHHVEGIG